MLSGDASVRGRVAAMALVSLLALFSEGVTVFAQSGGGSGQPAAGESPERAALALQPYKLQDENLVGGYFTVYTSALTNEAFAFEYVSSPDIPEARPAEALLQPLVSNRRIVSIRARFETEDDDAPAIRYGATLFGNSQRAQNALRDPSLAVFVYSDEAVKPAEGPRFGDGSAAFWIEADLEDGPERQYVLLWQRGRVVFSLSACCEPEAVQNVVSTVHDIAGQADERFARIQAPPSNVGRSAPYMPSAAERLQLYQTLAARLMPDNALEPDLDYLRTVSISNAMLLNDWDTAAGPLADPAAVYGRLLERERRILGLSKRFQTREETSNPAGSRFPIAAAGFHLYADSEGANEALRAPLEELSLRLSEEGELIEGKNMPLQEVAAPAGAPGGARAFRTRAEYQDGTALDVYSVRWLRGRVELVVLVAVAPGVSPDELLARAVQEHDRAFMANPLPDGGQEAAPAPAPLGPVQLRPINVARGLVPRSAPNATKQEDYRARENGEVLQRS